MPGPKYSRELIRRYSELDRAFGFHRGMVERRPLDANYDRVPLSCGHEREKDYSSFDTLEALHQAHHKTGPAAARAKSVRRNGSAKRARKTEAHDHGH